MVTTLVGGIYLSAERMLSDPNGNLAGIANFFGVREAGIIRVI